MEELAPNVKAFPREINRRSEHETKKPMAEFNQDPDLLASMTINLRRSGDSEIKAELTLHRFALPFQSEAAVLVHSLLEDILFEALATASNSTCPHARHLENM